MPSPSAPTCGDAAALRLEDVTLTYPDGVDENGEARTLRALDAVHFSAEAGTVTALVGPSGSGKSSLLAVAAALIRPSSGSVHLAGRELTGMRERELTTLRRDHVGTIFQQPNLLPSLTALDQLVLTAHLRGDRGRQLKAAEEQGAELLDLVGLASVANRRPHQLSGGQRQRVNIARALMGRPSVMLVDEPTSALDHERARSILELLVSTTRQFNTATVIVTHDAQMATLTDRTVTIRDGRLISER
ncbi:ABC transporter ATP-binding protein [Nesterenkonia sp. AY15]|nr:ABC transporter ATP-binding protein [Nesterenkonia sp. AY15]MCH8570269.1 ABC transporter ATP-binding protein [Nesterenkonia sp. AY15]